MLFSVISFCSCSGKDQSINDMFVKKYSKQVKQINDQRVLPKNIANEVISSNPPSNEEIADYIASQEKYQGYVPIYNVGEYVPKQYFPDLSTVENLAKNNPSNQVPADIFEVSYNTRNNPPFSYFGAEFDMINIPKVDAYGNSSQVSEKKYLLIANNDIQNAVEKINSTKSIDDIELTKILVKEKKQQIQQKKNQQIASYDQFRDIALIENYPDNEVQIPGKNVSKKNDNTISVKNNN
jgi:hypothetical protein